MTERPNQFNAHALCFPWVLAAILCYSALGETLDVKVAIGHATLAFAQDATAEPSACNMVQQRASRMIATGVAPDAVGRNLSLGNVTRLNLDASTPTWIPPIGFVKPFKTGSSTLCSILIRIGKRRNASFLVPVHGVEFQKAGESFPGKSAKYVGGPHHQFDMIVNHARFDTGFRAYLRPHPLLVSILREPVSRTVSAFNFYHFGRGITGATTWEKLLDHLEQSNGGGNAKSIHVSRHFRNSQAYQLGWYKTVGETTSYDHDEGRIRKWVASLDQDLGMVLILENTDMGLVLLGQRLGLDMCELVYLPMKVSTGTQIEPYDAQRKRVRSLNNVDASLYSHFNQTFWHAWASGDRTSLEADLSKLRGLNTDMQVACSKSSGPSMSCPREYVWDVPVFTRFERSKLYSSAP